MAIDPVTIQALRQDPSGEGQNKVRHLKIEGVGDTSFADMVRDAIQSVDGLQKSAEQGVEDILAGKAENIHEVMIAMEKAQIGFQLMVEIRNKAMETYQELSRMQI